MTQRLFCLTCHCWLEPDDVYLRMEERREKVHSWFHCCHCGEDHVYYSDHDKVREAIRLKRA